MKKTQMSSVAKTLLLFFLAFAIVINAIACAPTDTRIEKSIGQIFLYGEAHGIARIKEKQIEIWHEYYHNHNMRHMFIEQAYFTAEILNMWIPLYNDDILYELFGDWAGSVWHSPFFLFFKAIKTEFPETIFHGIDIGHEYDSIGKDFLQYLRDNDKQGTEQYLLTLEAIEQGKRFYKYLDWEYRTTKMTENFIREFDNLRDQDVMGIFGAAHTTLGGGWMLGLPNVPTMADRLRERYGDSVHTEDLSWLAIEDLPWFSLEIDPPPIRMDIISVNNEDYEASYFGTHLTTFRDIVSMSFWRLENAYNDFSTKLTIGDVLFFENYPMMIEINQVFVVDFTRTNGSVSRMFYRSDGNYWHGRPITMGVMVD